MVWPQSCGKTNHYPNFLTAGEGFIPDHAGKTLCSCSSSSQDWAHPRSRGENLGCDTQGVDVVGLIPTHTGKTLGRRPRLQRCWAHPRSHRENRSDMQEFLNALGSSPLTRRKLVVRVAVELPPGLIPAHAGKTSRRMHPRTSAPAHPRSRRENCSVCLDTLRPWGSSPLTRGKHRCGGLDLRDDGLIPAHTGKMRSSSSSTSIRRVHPRSRGENIVQFAEQAVNAGSSPLTRGKQKYQRVQTLTDGLIPAHAGKTASRRRGGAGAGLIPAHAGKTARRRSRSTASRAHPRSRRENVRWVITAQ